MVNDHLLVPSISKIEHITNESVVTPCQPKSPFESHGRTDTPAAIQARNILGECLNFHHNIIEQIKQTQFASPTHGMEEVQFDTRSGWGLSQLSSQSTNTSSPTTPINDCTRLCAQFGTWPTNIVDLIKSALTHNNHPSTPSCLRFDFSDDTATHNWSLLQQYDSLQNLLDSDKDSFTAYGSEFRSISVLEPIFSLHPLWGQLKNILTHGMDFPLDDLPLTSRKYDLESALKFGNHKGMSKNPEIHRKLNLTDVTHGYAIIIPLQSILELEGALLCPMNVVDQHTISDRGQIIEKQRACHDLSFRFQPSNSSVNSRVHIDALQQCRFGHCLLRLVNYIVTLRLHNPFTPIVLQKTDWKSAYRRAHLHSSTAIQCCTQYNNYALIPLRAIFGGSPCPSMW